MSTRERVVAEARSWLGVPFKHQGRSRAGIDCAGLLLNVGKALGLTDLEFANYGITPMPGLQDLIEEHAVKIDELRLGCFCLFRVHEDPQHLGIVGNYDVSDVHDFSLIHALNQGPKQVVETRLDDKWRNRIVAIYDYPGVEP